MRNLKVSCVYRFCLSFISVFLISDFLHAQTYTYDEKGRVSSVSHGSKTTCYSYDSAGNRTSTLTSTSPCSSSSSSGGQPPNNPPICNNGAVHLGGIPPAAGAVTIPISAATFLSYCSDSDGDTLTLNTPNTPYNVVISAGQTIVITFKVTDSKSPEVSATLTYSRP